MFSNIARPSSVPPDGPSAMTSTGLLGFKSPVPYDSDKPAVVLIDAVGEHTDRDTGAIDVELGSRGVGEHRRLGLVVGYTLIFSCPSIRLVQHLAAHRLGHFGDRRQRVDRGIAVDQAVDTSSLAVICMPTSVSWVSNCEKSPPRLFTCSPTSPILKIDLWGTRPRAATCCRRCPHTPRKRRPYRRPGWPSARSGRPAGWWGPLASRAARAASAAGQQLPVLEKLDPGDSIPPRFPLAQAPLLRVFPIVSLEARHRQTPRLALRASTSLNRYT